MRDVNGRAVLITGGAAGMGRLWAERFAADGARLALWDISEDALNKTAEALRATGSTVITDIVNVADSKAVYKAAKKLEAELGGIDVLVNNAGIVRSGDFLDTPDEDISAVLDVNLKGIFWTMKAFLPRMVERNDGHIVNISSASGFIGVPKIPAYVASKWGVIGLTESVKMEIANMKKDGVHFTVVCPSYVDTGMFEGARPPRMTKMLRPENIVNVSYEAFKKNKFMVMEPFMVKFTPALKSLLPARVFDSLSSFLGVNTSMHQWTGHSKR